MKPVLNSTLSTQYIGGISVASSDNINKSTNTPISDFTVGVVVKYDDITDEYGKIRVQLDSIKYGGSVEYAYPMNVNILQHPIVGELVTLFIITLGGSSSRSVYYNTAIPVYNKIGNNIIHKTDNVNENYVGSSAESAITKKYNNTISILDGDTLFQGRHNQTIRFSTTFSSKNNLKEYSPVVSDLIRNSGLLFSKNGNDPYICISLGKKKLSDTTKNINTSKIGIESIFDDSLIFMSTDSTLNYKFKQRLPSSKKKIITNYDGKYIYISSDRLIFNSVEKETMFFSKGDFIFTTDKSVLFKTGAGRFEIESQIISLGNNAFKDGKGDKAVSGKKLVDVLLKLIDAVFFMKHNQGLILPGTDVLLINLKKNLNELKINSKSVKDNIYSDNVYLI